MNFPVLLTRGLTKDYGTTRALDQVALAVRPGEALAVMGPSGSGKTTLMHCLSGILPADAGEVVFTGPAGQRRLDQMSDADRSALRRHDFGFVFQQGLLLPELTAVENAALPLMLTGVDRRTAEQHAAAWMAQLGLAGMEGRRLGQMSGGQAQRVAIARSQVTGPLVTFADEPTGALDQNTSHEVLAALLQATVGRGRTLVMVTHDEHVASRCHRVVRLQDGRIVHDSNPLPVTGSSGGQPVPTGMDATPAVATPTGAAPIGALR